ncbi:MAG: 2-phosphosulfolactate phosphatase [Lachnospiraceae bacterium]|nr:2-phosphosulfolactate phosphatase [Lachnospiraceae bacterium]
MNVQIYQCLAGAKEAHGFTVVIDVFRAFSLECFFMSQGAKTVLPVGSAELAYQLKEQHPDWLLAGERHAVKLPGFDFGNSPAQVQGLDFTGKTIIHTTSAGTQGIANAVHATEIVTGSLLNAAAIARYIKKQNPTDVSLVCMGYESVEPSDEDTLCAEYIQSLLLDDPIPMDELKRRAAAMEFTSGARFFLPELQHAAPKEDFYLCTQFDQYDFVLRVDLTAEGYHKVTRIDS